jgi:hypothetical protein
VPEQVDSSDDQARDQFAAIGLFIQNFENVVATLRGECSRILRGAQLGVSFGNPETLLVYLNITSLVFHHETMTARPLLDIWRALVFEQTRGMLLLSTISEKGRSIATEIVTEIAKEFIDLVEARNRLIHANWRIGFRLPHEDDLSKIHVEKYRVTKDGLQQRGDLPQSFDELMKLGNRASKLLGKLGRFLQFFIYQPNQIELVYSKTDGNWAFDRVKFDAITKPEPSPAHSAD